MSRKSKPSSTHPWMYTAVPNPTSTPSLTLTSFNSASNSVARPVHLARLESSPPIPATRLSIAAVPCFFQVKVPTSHIRKKSSQQLSMQSTAVTPWVRNVPTGARFSARRPGNHGYNILHPQGCWALGMYSYLARRSTNVEIRCPPLASPHGFSPILYPP